MFFWGHSVYHPRSRVSSSATEHFYLAYIWSVNQSVIANDYCNVRLITSCI